MIFKCNKQTQLTKKMYELAWLECRSNDRSPYSIASFKFIWKKVTFECAPQTE